MLTFSFLCSIKFKKGRDIIKNHAYTKIMIQTNLRSTSNWYSNYRNKISQ